MWVAGFALFVLGIVFVIVAPINRRKNARCSAQTQGRLIETFETENSSGGGGHAFVFSYYVDGIEYRLKSSAASKEAKNVGDQCTIWYNPKKPKDAQVFHYDSAKVYQIILIIGIVMILLGAVLTMFGASQ